MQVSHDFCLPNTLVSCSRLGKRGYVRVFTAVRQRCYASPTFKGAIKSACFRITQKEGYFREGSFAISEVALREMAARIVHQVFELDMARLELSL